MEKKNTNDLRYNWLVTKLKSSILKDESVVKLPKKPTYTNKYELSVNLLRKIPAISEPIMFTKIVDTGNPMKLYWNILMKYLNEAPNIDPTIRAK